MKLSTAKKRAWKAFSRYIRQAYSDHAGYVVCCTCTKVIPWQEADAGHYIPKSRGNAIYFEETNVHPQCKGCNLTEGGRFEDHAKHIVEIHGPDEPERLRQLSKTTKKYSIQDYLDIESEYKEKLNEL